MSAKDAGGEPLSPMSSTLRARLDVALDEIAETMVADRRDFHRYAETGWQEFRTASLIARRLKDLGLDVAVGREVVDPPTRMGLPADEVLEVGWRRAELQGGDPAFLEAVRGGFTGVVGTLSNGEGPTIGLRFDIDALDLTESRSAYHRPYREGFASINAGASHACGHDGHAAIGLGLASVLSQLRTTLRGTIRFVFQPAEEGVRGAKAMVAAGVVEGVDAMLALHLYSGWPVGQVVPGKSGFLATTKLDAFLTGEPAHAGGRPHGGRNAILAAATAVLNLHAIPRHSEGATRINVGRLVAGEGRNVIPSTAHLVLETRGVSSAVNDHMVEAANRVLEAAAAMYGCELEIRPMGAAESATSDDALAQRVTEAVERLPGLSLRVPDQGGGSEDYTYMMRRVQEQGGLATNIGFGADLGGFGHHTATFDFDEAALPQAVRLLATAVLDLQARPVRR